jgi:hypothetical protein
MPTATNYISFGWRAQLNRHLTLIPNGLLDGEAVPQTAVGDKPRMKWWMVEYSSLMIFQKCSSYRFSNKIRNFTGRGVIISLPRQNKFILIVSMLMEDMSRTKCFFQFWISRFTFYIHLWPIYLLSFILKLRKISEHLWFTLIWAENLIPVPLRLYESIMTLFNWHHMKLTTSLFMINGFKWSTSAICLNIQNHIEHLAWNCVVAGQRGCHSCVISPVVWCSAVK